jgi:hypothetical protein
MVKANTTHILLPVYYFKTTVSFTWVAMMQLVNTTTSLTGVKVTVKKIEGYFRRSILVLTQMVH